MNNWYLTYLNGKQLRNYGLINSDKMIHPISFELKNKKPILTKQISLGGRILKWFKYLLFECPINNNVNQEKEKMMMKYHFTINSL